MNEAALQSKMVKTLRKRGAWAGKTHGGIHMRAWPDIVACYRGWFIGLEVKLPGKERTLTDHQAHTLEQIADADGESLVVTTVAQVVAVLDNIDRIEDR